MVSLIQSNYMGFGSAVVVPGTGISLQNRGGRLLAGARASERVGGGKRPFHTIIPGFHHEGRRAARGRSASWAARSSPGARADRRADARLRHEPAGRARRATLEGEQRPVHRPRALGVRRELRAGLAALGHRYEAVADSYMDFGAGQFIVRTEGGYVAAVRSAARTGTRPGSSTRVPPEPLQIAGSGLRRCLQPLARRQRPFGVPAPASEPQSAFAGTPNGLRDGSVPLLTATVGRPEASIECRRSPTAFGGLRRPAIQAGVGSDMRLQVAGRSRRGSRPWQRSGAIRLGYGGWNRTAVRAGVRHECRPRPPLRATAPSASTGAATRGTRAACGRVPVR